MSDKNLWWKLGGVLLLILFAIFEIYPPQTRLKGAIDISGGSVLLYEIDTKGIGTGQNVAQELIQILQRRVDPDNVRNLVWRPVGTNRIEIQMPRPPQEALARRRSYEEAAGKLRETNITRGEVENALSREGPARATAFETLVRGVADRKALLDKVSEQWDAIRSARTAKNAEAEDKAVEAYDAAMGALLATNVPFSRFGDLLALENKDLRKTQLSDFRKAYPARTAQIDDVIAKYDLWSAQKGPLEDPADLKRLLRGAGVLEFRILPEKDPANPTQFQTYVENLARRGPRYRVGGYSWHRIEKPLDFLNVDSVDKLDRAVAGSSFVLEKYGDDLYVLAFDLPNKGLLANSETKWSLQRAIANRDPNTNQPVVDFFLDPRGGSQFYQLTNANLKKALAILLDDVVYSAPRIQSAIRQRGQISGDFSTADVMYLVNTLQAGSLPARLKDTPLMERTIGPSLGEVNRRQGLQASALAFLLTILFMTGYYFFGGLVADLALSMNLLITLAAMAMLEATFTLPGIAGVVLSMAMAVDANVLIFERMREELARGASLRTAIKLGYEKAFSAIFDSNVTTVITCVILGYVGSEEVKGFAITLGLGIAISMFTAIVVTRLVFTFLVSKGLLKSLKMMSAVPPTKIDWMGKRAYFAAFSLTVTILGLVTYVLTPAEDKYDIEFLGGTSAQITLKEPGSMTDEDVRQAITGSGLPADRLSSTSWLLSAAEKLRSAKVTPAGSHQFDIEAPGLSTSGLSSLIQATAGKWIPRDGIDPTDKGIRVALVAEENVTLEQMQQAVADAAQYASVAASKVSGTRVQVTEESSATEQKANASFEIITTETNQQLVREAILAALPGKLAVQEELKFTVVKDPAKAPKGFYPIGEEDRYLSDVIGGTDALGLQAFRGGVVMVIDQIQPPQTVDDVSRRLRNMRLQPGFQQYEWRTQQIQGLASVGGTGAQEKFSKMAVIVVDEDFPYYQDPEEWERNLATPELDLITTALSTGQAMEKVTQFAPQIAAQSQQQALVALVLAMLVIIGYLWIRFQSLQFGLAGIMSLVHDICVTLGLVVLTDLIAGTFIGRALGFEQAGLRIDMTMIAAVLTIIGYSLNDTIVVFDRIRENRGRLTTISDTMVNASINQTLSRTLLTGISSLMVLVVLYIGGGAGIHAFAFSMFFGIVTGTYSSIGVASALLTRPRTLYVLTVTVAAMGLAGVAAQIPTPMVRNIILGLVLVATAFAVYKLLPPRAEAAPARG